VGAVLELAPLVLLVVGVFEGTLEEVDVGAVGVFEGTLEEADVGAVGT